LSRSGSPVENSQPTPADRADRSQSREWQGSCIQHRYHQPFADAVSELREQAQALAATLNQAVLANE